jgi:probable HAF family extracellular repeat protein
MVVLDELPDKNLGTSSQAFAINDFGQVAGGYGGQTINTTAFLWTPVQANGSEGEMVDLGKLPGSIYSRSEDINSQGETVGSSFYEDASFGHYRAFLWAPTEPNSNDGTMLDLNSLLEPTTGAGWELTAAYGINDRGQIVGSGVYDPDGPGGVDAIGAAFLLTPVPEPPTPKMVGMLGLACALFARRRNGKG